MLKPANGCRYTRPIRPLKQERIADAKPFLPNEDKPGSQYEPAPFNQNRIFHHKQASRHENAHLLLLIFHDSQAGSAAATRAVRSRSVE